MKYAIEVTYQTGDSFGSETAVDTLSPVWSDIKKAEKALTQLEEYNDFYKVHENLRWVGDKNRKTESDKIETIAKRREWYVDKDETNPWAMSWLDRGMTMEMDDGSRLVVSTHFITGYFEHFEGAKIVVYKEEDDLKSFDTGWGTSYDVNYLEKKYVH